MSGRRRRILVALDASPSSLTAARAAAALAAAMSAELAGLFIEDINLVRSAELPCTFELGGFSAHVRALDVRELESRLRAEAERARQALERLAEGARVDWTFQVARGGVPKTLRAEAEKADFVTLGRTGWSSSGQRLGSTTRAMLREGRGRFLMPERGVYTAGPTRILLEDAVPLRDLLDAGVALSPRAEPVIELLALARDEAAADRLEEQAQRHLAQAGLHDDFQWIGRRPESLLRVVREYKDGVLVASAASPSLQEEDFLGQLIHQAGCPVLLVR